MGSARQKKEAARVGLDGFRETAEMSTDTHIMPDSPEKVKVRIETAFLAVPDAIARDQDLSPGAKLLFGCIHSLSMTSRHCYGSNASLAKRVGLSVKQVKRLLPELEERGLISRKLDGADHRRGEITVTWKGKPLKMRDKLSKRPNLGTKCPQGPRDKLSPGGGDKLGLAPRDKLSPGGGGPPTIIGCSREIQDESKSKFSGSEDPEKTYLNSREAESSATSLDGSPPTRQDQPGKLIPWRRLVYGNESVEDVCGAATAAGYTVGFREEGKLIDLAPADGRKPTYRDREAMTEFGKRIRLAQKAATEAEAIAKP